MTPPTGNGYIEGGELESFLREFVSSISDDEQVSSSLLVYFFIISVLKVEEPCLNWERGRDQKGS